MKRINILFIGLIILSLYGMSRAQNNAIDKLVFNAGDLITKPTGLLDKVMNSEKFTMSQSYSFSVGTLGKQSFSQGLYLNQMTYQLAQPLTLQLGIGLLHQPFGSSFNTQNNSSQFFVQSARIKYKPSDKFSVTFDFQSGPGQLWAPYSTEW